MTAEERRQWALDSALLLVIAGLATESRAGITMDNACDQLRNLTKFLEDQLRAASEAE